MLTSLFRNRLTGILLAATLVAMLASAMPRAPLAPSVASAAVVCLGDVNTDTNVNSLDLLLVAQHYGPMSGSNYNPIYDLNNDTNINSLDLLFIARHYGPCTAAVYVSNLLTTGVPINGFGPFERNKSNGENAAGDGGPITINGVVYSKGLGVHADSILRFTMPPNCTQFQAQAGIDDEVGANGSVTFEVWDGVATRLYQSPVKTGVDAATAVSVDVTGVSELRLVVVKGPSDAFDHADWGDAKVMCANDGVAPAISSVAALPSSSSTTITWNTNEIASSQIDYGPTAAYGSTTTLDPMLVSVHTHVITGLAPGATYHYRIRSRDLGGNLAVTADATFTTTASLFGPAASFGAGNHTHSVVIRELNGDAKADVVTANAGADTISVLLGDGLGGFASPVSYATGSQPKSVTLGDVNGDTKLDAVTANQGDSTISVLLGNGDGTFGAKTDLPGCTNAHEATLALLNADAALDIACAGWGAAFMGVLLNNGAGVFAPMASYVAGAAPHSLAAGLFNNDAILDLAVANHDAASISVYIGNGDGTFQSQAVYASGAGPHSLRIADLSGDGDDDIVNVNDAGNDVSVFLGNGAGTFGAAVKYATRATPKGVAIADINGDTKLDILAATINSNYPSLVNPGGDAVSVLLGNGDGTFQPKTDYPVGQGSFAVAAGLINGDAKLDIATANWWDSTITLRLNTLP